MKRKFLIGLAMSLFVAVTMSASATPEPQNVQGLSTSSETFHANRPTIDILPPIFSPEVSETPQVTTDPWIGLEDAIEQEKIRLYVEAVEKAEAEEAQRQAAREAERQAEAARKAEEARQAAAAPPAPAAPSGSVWDRLAQCESGGDWGYGPHSGWGSGIYHGGLQFHPNTWSGFGGTQYATYAYQASRSQQIAIAEKVLASQGWGAWPKCSRDLGLR